VIRESRCLLTGDVLDWFGRSSLRLGRRPSFQRKDKLADLHLVAFLHAHFFHDAAD
jgi:hypothetical protein